MLIVLSISCFVFICGYCCGVLGLHYLLLFNCLFCFLVLLLVLWLFWWFCYGGFGTCVCVSLVVCIAYG